jgi:hypothetical protein
MQEKMVIKVNDQEKKEIQRIIKKLGTNSENLLDLLSKKIPLSDLNTLLLELFRTITDDHSAGELLKRYATNRFVAPAKVNPIRLKQLEIDTLEIAQNFEYIPVQLSPVAPLGACSIVASVDQNKIISALRGTEVVSDATNVLALQICDSIKSGKLENRTDSLRFSSTHRHVRAQNFNRPGALSHFHLFCMVASGRDTGSYSFEKQSLLEHINVYQKIFMSLFKMNITVSLNGRDGYTDGEGFMHRMMEYIQQKSPEITILENANKAANEYYKGLQFTISVNLNGKEVNIGDGGFVDWSQKLLGNKKERMMISAIGLERLL